MSDAKKETKAVSQDLSQYTDAMKVSIDYCKPKWESYIRFQKLWRGEKPPELDATISQIWINIFNSTVNNRFPLIFENVFSQPEYLTLKATDPRFELSVDPAQTWLRDLLDDKIKIRNSAIETVQSALIGGNGFRMPYVHYKQKNGKQVPIITSRDLSYFNVLPSPNGSRINPGDYDHDDGLDWMFVIDWWTEDKIKKLGTRSGFNKEQIAKLLKQTDGSGEQYEEDNYKNQYKTINGLDFNGMSAEYDKIDNIPSSMRKRRLVHWFRRDKHIIVAEDRYVIYSGKPPMGDGIIPVVNYCVNPDPKNFYGISQIEMVEDLVMAMVMNFNYRMDHLLGVMFPTTWIRDDLWRGKSEDDFIPRPYSVNKFPVSVDISSAIHYDRRPEVTQQTFMDEDRMKQFLQAVSGEMETTGSYGDVVGNRSATGVTTIAQELQKRPNMEAAILEETGFRPEAELLLKLGAMHVNEPVSINTAPTQFATAWTEISPHDIADKFTVQMHGARHHIDQAQQFQRTMALYPFWNGNPGVDQFELNRQVNEIADVLPSPDKVFIPPAPVPPEASSVRPSALPAGPGGIAAAQNGQNTATATQNRNTVEPGTGRTVEAM